MSKLISRINPIAYLLCAAIGILLLFKISDTAALAAVVALLIIAPVALGMIAMFGGPKLKDG